MGPNRPEIVGWCWRCQRQLESLDYGRRDTCPQCQTDTRVCRNCSFFDASHYNACREPQADRVVEKDRANTCDYFKPGDPRQITMAKHSASHLAQKARDAAEALFKKK